MSRYIHLCHLKNVPEVHAEQFVKRGQLVGFVGNTGHSTGPHLHIEGTWSRPLSWYQYPASMSLEYLKKQYFDPSPFIYGGIPCEFTYKGYGFLQTEPTGIHHLGVDINSPNDLGKPVFSPVNGRVQFAEGVHWVRNFIGKLVPSFLNHGFGNHIWIEVDESNPENKH